MNSEDKAPQQSDNSAISIVNSNPSELNRSMKDKLSIYEIECKTLSDLARLFKEKLSMDVIQIVAWIREHNVDVVVCGEILEWTLCAYINDAKMLVLNKGMIVLGH
ncbi:hypothetical protein [Aquibacillus saliphilus]|uniref:hypothetical protein n=1 Tax=Aquibacillus saliphilus TaxID=1909422 RepID=UPI001CEFC038|nr:hypothetical protein [Aquibacillus saliphilus]